MRTEPRSEREANEALAQAPRKAYSASHSIVRYGTPSPADAHAARSIQRHRAFARALRTAFAVLPFAVLGIILAWRG
jgi:hypothetical protein